MVARTRLVIALAGPSRLSPPLYTRSIATCLPNHNAQAKHATPARSESVSDADERSSSSSAVEGLTGSDRLLAEALRLEKEEEQHLARQSFQPDPNDPIWTGEERVQDTVLRMLMDKYKPLRIPSSNPSTDPADEKIKAGFQNPTKPGEPPSSYTSFSNLESSIVGDGEFEGGRKLPKTPDAKPWRAVYVRPPHLLGAGAADTPSIHYGQFLKTSSSSTATSEMRKTLKAAGVNLASLRVDDSKAMNQLRQTLKTAQRRSKLVNARDSVLDYQLTNSSLNSSAVEEGEVRGDEVSDTNRNLQLQLGHAQGWDSVVEKRIKTAYDAGVFRENKLRGKPIKRDMEEKNPFLAREEYFMNRIVKRQGAAPPWVELNVELETELSSWRGRMVDAWVRRASRMVTTSATLSQGLEPVQLSAGAATEGQKRLLDVAKRYRNSEWLERERAYHEVEIKRLNDLIRKHNHLAPFTARKGLVLLDLELASMYERAFPRLVAEISSILDAKLNGRDGTTKDGWGESLASGNGVVSYDMWGREIKPPANKGKSAGEKGSLDGWFGTSVGAGKGDGQAAEVNVEGKEGGERGEGSDGGVMDLGILAAIQKSLMWARQRIGA